jgi:hypothetical protein
LDIKKVLDSEPSPFESQAQPATKAMASEEPAPSPVVAVPPGASATRAAGVLSHYADAGPSALASDVVQKAVAWGRHQHFSPALIAELQTAVGASATGSYDEATVQAVASTQRLKGEVADGKAGQKTREILGLKSSAKAAAPAKGKTQVSQHIQPPKEGVSVALFNQFDTQKTNKGDLEFERRADQYAKEYQAAGLRDGALVWNKSTPFKGLDALTSSIQDIHRALVNYVHPSEAKPAAADVVQAANPAEPAPANSNDLAAHSAVATSDSSGIDEQADHAEEKKESDHSTQIKHLAIFTHGMEYGIDTNPDAHSYRDGLHKDLDRKHPSNIGEFVTNVSDALTPDVSVQLYACSTGRDKEQGKKAELEMPKGDEHLGSDSFAAHLAEELSDQGHKEASVFAHINAKHTTENPYARVFGNEADDQVGGKPLFDLLYSAEFTDGEILKLVPDYFTRPPEEQEQLYGRMRAMMWDHYIDSIYKEHNRRDHGGKMAFGHQTYMGMATFQDPEGSSAKLQADFQTRWLTKARQHAILAEHPSRPHKDHSQ